MSADTAPEETPETQDSAPRLELVQSLGEAALAQEVRSKMIEAAPYDHVWD